MGATPLRAVAAGVLAVALAGGAGSLTYGHQPHQDPEPTPAEDASPNPIPTPVDPASPASPAPDSSLPQEQSAAPEPPDPVDADEIVPVQPADPGAIAEDVEAVPVQSASPEVGPTSVPQLVPAGAGAAGGER